MTMRTLILATSLIAFGVLVVVPFSFLVGVFATVAVNTTGPVLSLATGGDVAIFQGIADTLSSGVAAAGVGSNILDYQQTLHNQDVAATGGNLPSFDKSLVQSAQAAGMSPLAMLGVNPASGAVSGAPAGFDDLASSLSRLGGDAQGMGQDLSRAIGVNRDATERMQDLDLQLKEAQVDKLQADASATRMGALINAQVSNPQPAGSPPARPSTSSMSDTARVGFYGAGMFDHILRILDRLERR